MSVVWQVLQFVLTVVETGLCFAFYNMLTGTEYPERWKWVVQGIAILGIAYLWAGNRQYAMVSNLEVFFLMILIFIAMVIIGNKNYVVVFGMTFVYLSSHELLCMLYGDVVQFYLGKEVYWSKVHLGKLTGWRILIYLAVVLTLLCAFKIIKDWKQHFDILKMEGVLLVIGILEWWTFTWAIGQAIEQQRGRSLWTVSILLVLILAMVAFFIVYIRYLIEKSNNEKIELKNQIAEKSYQETKRLLENSMLNLHDWKNHILILQNYMEQQEYDRTRVYLRKIGASVEVLSQYIWCGNEVINLIINTKLIEAREKDIRVSIDVENIAADVEDYDLCSILSNLIDNAIEACEKVVPEKRWISIVIREKSRVTVIKIENSISKIPLMKNCEYVSEKKGRHGYGLKSVKNAVKKNGGAIKITNDTEVFSVTITFF